MKTNKPYIYYILLSFSVVGIEITYAVPYYVKIYHFSFWEWSLLSMTVGPFIGFVVQPLVGWLGDNNVLGLGKRRPFIVVGVFIWIIGSFLTLICGGYALQFQLDNNAQGKDYELYFGVNTIMDIMFCVSLIINYVGLNTIQVSSRAIILDLVAVKEQYKAELMSTAVSGIGKLLYCVVNIMVYFTNNDNTNVMLIIVYIMIIMCMVIIPVSSSVTLFAAIEEEKIPKKSYNSLFKELLLFFKQITRSRHISSLFVICFCGWFAFSSFDTNIDNFFKYHVVEDLSSNTSDRWIIIMDLVMSILQILFSVALCYTRNQSYYIFTFSHICAGFLSVNYLLVMYLVPNDMPLSIMLSYIPPIVIQLCWTMLLSLPFTLLGSFIESERYGFYVGMLNSVVVFAQFLVNLFGLVINASINNTSEEEDSYNFSPLVYLSITFYIICGVSSFILNKVNKLML